MSSGAFVMTASSRAVLQACEQRGVDTAVLLSAVGLDSETVQDADARIPLDQALALAAVALQQTGDRYLALHAAETLPMGAYAVTDFLIATSRTIGEGFQKLARYYPTVSGGARFEVSGGDSEVCFRLETLDGSDLPSMYVEYSLGSCAIRSRKAGQPLRLERVDFRFDAPDDTREYERVFDCTVHFGAQHNQLVLSREVWETPLPGGDAGLRAAIEGHADAMLERIPRAGGFVACVRRAIDQELCGGDPTLEAATRKLGVSSRTLQRRLQEAGETFAGLLDQARHEAAERYLRQPGVALCEVSHLLGFSDQSAFNRAFKRWKGSTPRSYRQALAKQAAS